jgi:muconolactone D-isomerase
MQFLLRVEIALPPEMPEADKAALREREHARGHQLVEEGMLLRIWRVVGRIAQVSIWQARSPEHLHEVLTSLPMFPYMRIDVTPIIDHPMTPVTDSRNGRAPEMT